MPPSRASGCAIWRVWQVGSPPCELPALCAPQRPARAPEETIRGINHLARQGYTRPVLAVKALFWGSLGALAWTHVGYPLAAGALARVRERRVEKDSAAEPTVSVIVAAYNEESVIERRLDNLLALDYPVDRLEI